MRRVVPRMHIVDVVEGCRRREVLALVAGELDRLVGVGRVLPRGRDLEAVGEVQLRGPVDGLEEPVSVEGRHLARGVPAGRPGETCVDR